MLTATTTETEIQCLFFVESKKNSLEDNSPKGRMLKIRYLYAICCKVKFNGGHIINKMYIYSSLDLKVSKCFANINYTAQCTVRVLTIIVSLFQLGTEIDLYLGIKHHEPCASNWHRLTLKSDSSSL